MKFGEKDKFCKFLKEKMDRTIEIKEVEKKDLLEEIMFLRKSFQK